MSLRDGRGGLWRSRWAAIGAAVAITFGAGGLLAVDAAGGVESSTVMIDPARVLDTRDPVNVGLPGPFASRVSQKLQITGSVPTTGGTATVVPTGATGVLLNVTSVSPTANGFISIRPGDLSGPPATSSLNVNAGSNVPNAVQVALPTTGANAGKIDITYDAYGVTGPTTDILIDVVGYTTSDLLDSIVVAMPFAVSARDDFEAALLTSDFTVVSVQLTAPFDGQVTVNTSTNASSAVAGEGVNCSITNQNPTDTNYLQEWESSGPNGDRGQLSGTRVFDVQAGSLNEFRLRCYGTGYSIPPGPTAVLNDSVITAIYTPAP